MASSSREREKDPTRTGLGATMADVAAIAGVTKMTVSRVLRHPELVRTLVRQPTEAGHLVMVAYVCGSCGLTEWYTLAPGTIPIGEVYGTVLVRSLVRA